MASMTPGQRQLLEDRGRHQGLRVTCFRPPAPRFLQKRDSPGLHPQGHECLAGGLAVAQMAGMLSCKRESTGREWGWQRSPPPPPFQHRRPPLAETSLTLDLCPPPKATVFARRQPTTPVGSVFQSRVLAGPWWSRETLPEPGRGSARPTQGHPGSPPAELCPPLVTLSPKGQSGRRGDNVPVTGRAFGFTAKKKTKTRYSVSSW